MTRISPRATLPAKRARTLASLVVATATVAASLLIATPANAVDVVFADPALQACVNQSLGQPATAPVSTSQAASITQLGCYGQGITNLDGIQALTSVWDLSLSNNALTNLSPLAGLTKITQINLANNQITDLGPLASLTNLVYISAGGNAYSDLTPLTGLTQTKSLDISRSNVSDLGPLASLSLLEGLVMGTNTVSDLTPLAGLVRMAALYADNNQISDLTPLSGLTKIFQLFLNNNNISDLAPLATITALDNVRLQENHIADLSPLGGLPVLAQVAAQDQTLVLPDVVVGQSTPNPLREPHGATHTGVTGDTNFILATDGASWTYSAPASNTIVWDMSYPGPVWPAWSFSGTIQQRSTEVPVDPRPTTLVDDTATTVNPQAITIDVLSNDGLSGEPALDTSTLALIDSNGNPVAQLTVTGGVYDVTNGRVVFTPAAGFVGAVDEVLYTVTNSEGVIGRASIRVTVTAPVKPEVTTPAVITPSSAPGAGTLASTGVDVAPLGLLAALAALLGFGAMVISRRTRAN